jgi:hypothetical protein
VQPPASTAPDALPPVAVVNFDRVSQLGQIRTPTHIVCAEDDYLTPSYMLKLVAC